MFGNMDWLKSNLATLQKSAQEAAGLVQERSKVLMQQASEQAMVLAEQAAEKAKVLAAQAAEEAQLKLKEFATAAAAQPAQASTGPTEQDLLAYGITPGLMETIAAMSYSTFSDYPMDALPSTNPMGLSAPIPPLDFKLSDWQERHATLALQAVENLQGLRFALCPRRMKEELFWIIYFTLLKTLLPKEAFKRAQVASASQDAAGSTPSSTTPQPAQSAAKAPLAVSLPLSTPAVSLAAPPPSPPQTAARGGLSPLGAAPDALTPGSKSVGPRDAAASAGSSPEGVAQQGASSSSSHVCVARMGVVSATASGSTAGKHAEDSVSLNDEDLENLDAELDDGLDNDPELEAYLQEALAVDGGGEDGEGDDGEDDDGDGTSDLGDLDDYVNQLTSETGDDIGTGTPRIP